MQRVIAVTALLLGGSWMTCSAGVTTVTVLQVSSSSATLGHNETLTVQITPATATGKVTFYDTTDYLGTSTLSNGSATYSTALLAVGKHSFTARYDGDASNNPSVSAAVIVTVSAVAGQTFRQPAAAANASYGLSPVIADVNGDGIPDFALSGTDQVGVLVYLGNGDGTFQTPQTYLPSTEIYKIAFADMNGDGLPDMIVAENPQIVILPGTGGGAFGAPQPIPNQISSAFAVGDFNLDGIPDLALETTGPAAVILLGNGDGTFTALPEVYPGGYPLFVADVNGDGKPDIVGGSVLLGNGDGTFQELPPVSAADEGDIVALADVNGDGKLDEVSIFVANVEGAPWQVTVSLGNGNGTFGQASVALSNSSYFASLAVSDFNGDGKLDIAISGIGILFGNGDGTFQAPVPFDTGATPGNVASADLNGDGRADILSSTTNETLVYLGALSSSIALQASSTDVLLGASVSFSATVQAQTLDGTVSFYDGAALLGTAPLSGGTASLTSAAFLPGPNAITATYSGDASTNPSTSAPVTVTVNGAITATGLTVSPFFGSFDEPVTLTASVFPTNATGTISVYDYDAVIATLPLVGGVAVLTTNQLESGPHSLRARYNGSATLSPSFSVFVPFSVSSQPANTVSLSAPLDTSTDYSATPVFLGSGDFNGDGEADIAVIFPGAHGLSLLLGNGAGSFGEPQTIAGVPTAISGVAGDFNNDGKLDIAVVTPTSIAVLLGNGDGTFQSPVTLSNSTFGAPPPYQSSTPVPGDYNGDGVLDLAVPVNGATAILLGNGDGSFRVAPRVSNAGPLASGDFNGDGLTDLAIGSPTGINVLMASGGGIFQPAINYLSQYNIQGIVVGDFTGDGSLDIVGAVFGQIQYIAFTGISQFASLLNNRNGAFTAGPVSQVSQEVPLSTGDFNGDGRLDILCSGYDLVELGNGDGSFTPGFPDGNYTNVAAIAGNFTSNGRPGFLLSTPYLSGIQFGTLSLSASALISANVTSIQYGQPVTLTATIAPLIATGTVTFLNGAAVLGTSPVTSGTASLTVSNLPRGTASISASYSGDVNYTAATSLPVTITVAGLTDSLQLNASASSAALGQDVTFTAAVTPGTATGTVVFYDGAVEIGSATLSNGAAAYTTAALGTGAHRIRALYAGSSSDTISSSSAVPISITAQPATGFETPANISLTGNSLQVATGDFNKDGITDLAINTPTGVSVLLGNGDGTFHSSAFIDVLTYGQIGVADINVDGNPDIISGDEIFFGNGDGTFQTSSPPSGSGLLILDVNGDGIPDELQPLYPTTCNYQPFGPPCIPIDFSGVAVSLGNGDGTFNGQLVAGQLVYYTLFAGDFNGDGIVDFAGGTGTQLGILTGAGDGTFKETAYTFGTFQPLGVGDFNGDGKPDLYGTANGQAAVLLGNGDGTFQPPLLSPGGPPATAFTAAGDFNGDGKLDIIEITPGFTSPISVQFGNGDGTFQAPQIYATQAGFNGGAFVVSEFNNDGRPDIAVTDSSRPDIQILLGAAGTSLSVSSSSNPSVFGQSVTLTASVSPAGATGSVTFYDGVTVLGSGQISGGIATLTLANLLVGDHFITCSYAGSNLAAVSMELTQTITSPNASSVTLTASPNPAVLDQPVTLTAAGPGPAAGVVTFYDNAIPMGSAVMSNGSASFTTALLSSGKHVLTAEFSSSQNLAGSASRPVSLTVTPTPTAELLSETAATTILGQPTAIATGDFNADGEPDLAITDQSGAVQVLLGNGNGTFHAAASLTSSNSSLTGVVTADFNNDGIPDLAVADSLGSRVFVYLGTGGGQFQAPLQVDINGGVKGLGAGDFNGDGKIDLAITGVSGVSILLGAGDGSFTTASSYAVAGAGSSIVASDFNADGKTDLAVATGAGVSVYLGNGDGTFNASSTIALGSTTLIAVGDMNGDGKPDLVAAEPNSPGLTVMPGNGDGTFQAPVGTMFYSGPTVCLLLADVNGDGKLDVLADQDIFYGNGDGTLQYPVTLAGPEALALASADFNLDGRVDLAIASAGSLEVQLGVSQTFQDVAPSDYYFSAVELLQAKGITDGCSATDFCPNESISRAQMAIFIVRSIFGGDNFTYSTTPYFIDVPVGAFGFQWIQKMYELGITEGCAVDYFCPDDIVTRAQMAVFIIRARYGTAPFTYSEIPYFTDVPYDAFGFEWIQRMKQDSITNGCTTSTFCPDDATTRGEAAVFIMTGEFNQLLPAGTPVINSITPNTLSPGGSGTFLVTGSYIQFFQGTVTLVNPVGITASNVNVVSANSFTVTLTAAPDAALQPYPLYVQTDDGQQAVLPNGLVVQ